MTQILFVYQNEQIAFWKMTSRGLKRGALHGERWTDYSADYWTEWSEATQIVEDIDAILLVESSAKINALPSWLAKPQSTPSAWTLDQLQGLTEDAEFGDAGIELVQGKIRYQLASGDLLVSYNLMTSAKFKQPKPEAAKVETQKKAEPKKAASKPKTAPGLIGDSYNDPEALKLSVGDTLQGVVEKVFVAVKRNYVRVEGLKQQVCIKTDDAKAFAVGDKVSLTVTKVEEESKRVLFSGAPI